MIYQVTGIHIIKDINAPTESVLGTTTSRTLNLDSILKMGRTFLVPIAKHVWPAATTIQVVLRLSVDKINLYQMTKLSNLIVRGGVKICVMTDGSYHLIKAAPQTTCGPVRRTKVSLWIISREILQILLKLLTSYFVFLLELFRNYYFGCNNINVYLNLNIYNDYLNNFDHHHINFDNDYNTADYNYRWKITINYDALYGN